MNVTIHNYGRKLFNEGTGKEEQVFSNENIENKLSIISKNLMSQFVWDKEGLAKRVETPNVTVTITYKDEGLSETVINVKGFGMNIHTRALGYTEEESFNNALQKIMKQLSHRKGKMLPDSERIKDKALEEEYTDLMSQLDVLNFKMSMQKNANPNRYRRVINKYNRYHYQKDQLESEIQKREVAMGRLRQERDDFKDASLIGKGYNLLDINIDNLRKTIENIELDIASSTDAYEIIKLRSQKRHNEAILDNLINMKTNPSNEDVNAFADNENQRLLDESIAQLYEEIRQLSWRFSNEMSKTNVSDYDQEYENEELFAINLELAKAREHLSLLLSYRYENVNTINELLAQLEAEVAILTKQLDEIQLTKKDEAYMDLIIDEELRLLKIKK